MLLNWIDQAPRRVLALISVACVVRMLFVRVLGVRVHVMRVLVVRVLCVRILRVHALSSAWFHSAQPNTP